MENNNIIVRLATADDKQYATTITQEMEESAKARGTGIAQRSPEYIEKKMDEGKAVIAVTTDGTWVGFCYIEAWQHEKYVANSGLIVSLQFRKTGVATDIKRKIFELSRKKYPEAKIFGLTTGLAVMKINSDLGYEPVTYSELTNDEEFWKGCRSCVNFEILQRKNRTNCMCTAMLFDPAEVKMQAAQPLPFVKLQTVVTPAGKLKRKRRRRFKGNFKLFERWMRFKQHVLLRSRNKNNGLGNGEPNKRNSILSFFFW
ncbi:MAG: GNAT family N-acetyltransferase [Cyclobacteriaceae bacterium]|nr:GNAT family N-acetyltransferase [Cyclobacteriaceae bacterium]